MASDASSHCPVERIIRLLMGPWTTYILWVLRNQGSLRFGALRREIPAISAKMLTERLRLLEEAGLVVRDYKPTIPPEVSYCLSDKGQQLQGVLDGLNELALSWFPGEPAADGDADSCNTPTSRS